MKTKIPPGLGAALMILLMGCASTPVVLAPVGPNAPAPQSSTATGQLEVFSAWVGRSEGNNPSWYQHTDYYLCDQHGKELRRVNNTVGYYARAPRVITLPAGKYLVKALAKGGQWVEVPVVIGAGRITGVHLDNHWNLATATP